MPRKQCSAEFKAEAVELVRSSAASASAATRYLGLSPTMLNRWCREVQGASKPAFPGQRYAA